MAVVARTYTALCFDPKRFVCNFCNKEKSSNVTYLKRHMVSSACCAPVNVKRKPLALLLAGQHNGSNDGEWLQRLKRELAEDISTPAGAAEEPNGVISGKRR